MKIKNLLLLTTLLSISSFSWSQFAMMSVEGTKITKFNGESKKSGFTDKIEVLSFSMGVKSPRDASSGLSTGKRQHQPLTIWKLTGSSSPLFFTAITTNEALKKVTIEFYKPDDVFTGGKEILFYRIELSDAFVSNYRQVMGSSDITSFKSNSGSLYDEISFTYSKIVVTNVTGNVSGQDSWQSTNQ